VGFFQLLILRIPDHAAIYETVECARKPVQGLINAVLRKAAHCRMRLLRELPEVELAIQYSHPHWMWKRWKKLFGKDNTVALMDWNNQPAETYYRPNLLNPPPEGAAEPANITEAMATGHYYITDPSTSHAPELLAAKPGETVLDACAAPGGKAIHLAGLMQNEFLRCDFARCPLLEYRSAATPGRCPLASPKERPPKSRHDPKQDPERGRPLCKAGWALSLLDLLDRSGGEH